MNPESLAVTVAMLQMCIISSVTSTGTNLHVMSASNAMCSLPAAFSGMGHGPFFPIQLVTGLLEMVTVPPDDSGLFGLCMHVPMSAKPHFPAVALGG